MSKHCSIMTRMKENYESRYKYKLTRRTPVIIRLDGKAFHTYTKGLERPFDAGLIEDMQQTAIYLCQNIEGAKCAYVQSDEISILLTDYDKLNTQAWFDYNVQKIASVSASLATGIFNQLRTKRFILENYQLTSSGDIVACDGFDYKNIFYDDIKIANFDSRVFNIPKEEISNYFLARQKDAVKNSISMLAQSLYSHKELHKKNSNEKQEMCFQKGKNWNDLPFEQKRGSFIVKNTYVNDKKVEKTINKTFPFRTHPEQIGQRIGGEILANLETKRFKVGVEFINETGEEDVEYIELKNPVVRTKWEVVETPETFSESTFNHLI